MASYSSDTKLGDPKWWFSVAGAEIIKPSSDAGSLWLLHSDGSVSRLLGQFTYDSNGNLVDNGTDFVVRVNHFDQFIATREFLNVELDTVRNPPDTPVMLDVLWNYTSNEATFGTAFLNQMMAANDTLGTFPAAGSGDGDDIFYAGDGDDYYFYNGGSNTIHLNNSATLSPADRDTLDYSSAPGPVSWINQSQVQHSTGTDFLRDYLNIKFIGSSHNDEIGGLRTSDIIEAGFGDDKIYSRGGGDTIDGGMGENTLYYGWSAFSAQDLVVDLSAAQNQASYLFINGLQETTVNDTISNVQNVVGSGFDDTIKGDNFNNVLMGGGGSDLLIGLGGTNTLDGGTGILDTVSYEWLQNGINVPTFDPNGEFILNTGSSIDTIKNVERIIGTPQADVFGGTAPVQGLALASGANGIFEGGGGGDTFHGNGNADTLSYQTSNGAVVINLLIGSGSGGHAAGDTFSNIDNVIGSAFADTLQGNGTANELDGGAGADNLIGSAGNDTYVVDDLYDTVTELAGQGDDVVRTSVSYDLPDFVERLVMSGSDNIGGNGNGLANYITGNSGHNQINGGGGTDLMTGMGGNDTYLVDNRFDIVSESAGEGDDTVYTTVSFDVPANIEVLVMSGSDNINSNGSTVRDYIFGNTGENIINGAGGVDVMQGGAGNDTYAVDNSFDAVIEMAGASEGYDTVYTSVDLILAGNVETLILTGTAVQGFGDATNNQIFGNGNVNVLFGQGGDDYLLGLGGDDIFVITPEAGAFDVIGDFEGAGAVGGDRIAVAGFGAGAQIYQVSQASFEIRSGDNSIIQQFVLQGHDGTALDAGDYYFA